MLSLQALHYWSGVTVNPIYVKMHNRNVEESPTTHYFGIPSDSQSKFSYKTLKDYFLKKLHCVKGDIELSICHGLL